MNKPIDIQQVLFERFRSNSDISEDDTLAFIGVVNDILIDADIIDVPVATDFDAKVGTFRYVINLYELESTKPELVVGIVMFDFQNQEKILLKNDVDKYFSYSKNFVINSLTSALFKKLIDADYREMADLSESIYYNSDTISKIRIVFATNLNYKGKEFENEKILDKEIQFDIWDGKRFNRFLTSGIISNPIEIDFNEFNHTLPFIKVKNYSSIYDSFLTYFSGSFLEKIYDKFGTRLLERNVRVFLQTKGNINKSIQETIANQPDFFLAYNNGLTITCDELESSNDRIGIEVITRINDFQIVNGGQTIASLWHAKRKNKDVDLDRIQVIAKINLLKDKTHTETLASNISRYSNSQNKVSNSDRSGDSEYFRSLEKLSKAISTPESVPNNPGTKWFFERMRGGYAEEKNRKSGLAEINRFLKEYPTQQKIDKPQCAKLENTWRLYPYEVSRGAEKNLLFHSRVVQEEGFKLDENYFKRLVAKQIIWKKAEKIISDQKIPGYRANIITYTLSLIVDVTGNRIDLLGIWSKQEISKKFEECINHLSYQIRDILTDTKGNITEFCKSESCWKTVRDKIKVLPIEFDEILKIGFNPSDINKEFQPIDNNVVFVLKIPKSTWKNLASWGKHTGLMENFEKGICMSIGNRISKNLPPTSRQSYHGKKIYEKALRNGYKPE